MKELLAGYLLDCLLGDPEWLPHPVRLMGKAIEKLEPELRKRFPATPKGEQGAGLVLAVFLSVTAYGLSKGLIHRAKKIRPWLGRLVEIWLDYQILAVTSLRKESQKVYERLEAGDLPGARRMLSRIVGRDTDSLSESEVIRAAVETIGESTGDGIISPLFYMALAGAPLGMWYKGINTLDSMVGYQNSRYRHFGRAAALLDDAANFLPARLCGPLMSVAAELCGLEGKRAILVFLRDRKKHPSPNSAHPESACAGALGVTLGGPARYGGISKEKPLLGAPGRAPVREDIILANLLSFATSLVAVTAAVTLQRRLDTRFPGGSIKG